MEPWMERMNAWLSGEIALCEERRAALAALDRMRREEARTLPLWKRALLFLLAG